MICGSVSANAPPSDNEKIEWLQTHLNKLKGAEDSDSKYSDLAPLRKAIGKSRVVLLGEEHFDGSTFLTKTRMVKFLHEKMGFNLFVWEANLYDCDQAWKYLKIGVAGRSAAKRCMDSLWTDSEQVQPLFQYLSSEVANGNPLQLRGADMHPTGSSSAQSFASDFKSYLQKTSPASLRSKNWPGFEAMLQTLTDETPDWLPSDDDRVFFHRITTRLREKSERHFQSTHSRQSLLWSQYIGTLNATAEYEWCKNSLRPFTDHTDISPCVRIRDRQMAANILWTVKRAYPGKKIIVWMNSGHIARHLDQADIKYGN